MNFLPVEEAPNPVNYCVFEQVGISGNILCVGQGPELSEIGDVYSLFIRMHSTLWHCESKPGGRKILSQIHIGFYIFSSQSM